MNVLGTQKIEEAILVKVILVMQHSQEGLTTKVSLFTFPLTDEVLVLSGRVPLYRCLRRGRWVQFEEYPSCEGSNPV